MTDIAQLHHDLVTRILDGHAQAPRELRRAAFDNTGLDEPARALIDKVADRSYAVTDQDVAAVRDSGLSEDQIFEIMVCAAVGAAGRQYDSARAALAEAIGDRR
jgi:alkylhydroperoxidase/carboxymuconolactone decarboxylase family protein YurZ